ncbi:hypothetical protein AWW73_17715 [Acinetobacter lactucae]|uniref:hypothetical protein n=1 Tax=Acinetobacter lactucae TaxID=1785128 RepID=UPI0007A0AB24|nr:hypothetical protein [Acinetobacter lactucae]KYQ80100.1 hypothetical protein AWW73_17715 [Acinetobacter lactucae]
MKIKEIGFFPLIIIIFWLLLFINKIFEFFVYSIVFIIMGIVAKIDELFNFFNGNTDNGILFEILVFVSVCFFVKFLIKNKNNLDEWIAGKIENLKNKIFKKKNAENINKYKMILMMLGIYISICCLGLAFYRALGNEIDVDNKSDILNIFIWATYLIAPIVAIWVFSNWKVEFRDRERYNSLFYLNEKINETFLATHKMNNKIKETWDQKVNEIAVSQYSFVNIHKELPEIFINNYDRDSNFIVFEEYEKYLLSSTEAFFEAYNDIKNYKHKYNIVLIDIEEEFKEYLDSLEAIKSKLTPYSALFCSNFYESKAEKYGVFGMKGWIYELILNKQKIIYNLEKFDLSVKQLQLVIEKEIKDILN